MIAPWIPVTVVPTSFATVAIETFITELSSVIRNWPDASVSSTRVAPEARAGARSWLVTGAILPSRAWGAWSEREATGQDDRRL